MAVDAPTTFCPQAPDHRHCWLMFTLGRICENCHLVQAKDEIVALSEPRR
jgi:hypothetical protein